MNLEDEADDCLNYKSEKECWVQKKSETLSYQQSQRKCRSKPQLIIKIPKPPLIQQKEKKKLIS